MGKKGVLGLIDNSVNLYYVRNFSTKKYIFVKNVTQEAKNFNTEIKDIYRLLSNSIKIEIQKKFNSSPEKIKEDLESAKTIFNESVNEMLKINSRGLGEVQGDRIINAINKIKNISVSEKNLSLGQVKKHSKDFIALMGTDYFKEADLQKIVNSVNKDKKGGRRTEGEKIGALKGIASNLQGSLVENLVLKALNNLEKTIENITVKPNSAKSTGQEPGSTDRYKKADNTITITVSGKEINLGISIKAYFQEKQASFKAQDGFSLGRYEGTGPFATYLRWLSYNAVNNKSTAGGSYRRLMAATLADQALGGEPENRALASLFVLREGAGLKADVLFLNEVFDKYQNEPLSMLATVSRTADTDTQSSIGLSNVKVLIMAKISQRIKTKGVI